MSNISLNRMLDLCRARGAGLVHIHTPSTNGLNGLYVQKILKVPCVSTFHTMWDKYTPYLFGSRLNRLFKNPIRGSTWLYIRSFHSHCDATIAPSMLVKGELERHGIENVHFVPTAVDVSRLRPPTRRETAAARRRFGVPTDRKVILYLGRMGFEKNIPFLLRTLEATQDSVLVLGGKGPALELAMEAARKAGLSGKTIYAGFVRDEDLGRFYRMADVFAMPSRTETQGLTVLEAMACGRPVVVFGGATSELVGDRGVVAGSDSEFVDAVKELLGNPRTGGGLGRTGRRIAASRSLRRMAMEVDGVYARAREIFRRTTAGRGDFWTAVVRKFKGYESLEETFRRGARLGR